jgi:hypothetical protein
MNSTAPDEIVPILFTLKHVDSRPELRDEVLDLVAPNKGGARAAWGCDGTYIL